MEKIMDNIVKFDFNNHGIFINKVILANPEKQNEKDSNTNDECKCKKKFKETNTGILKDFIEVLISTIQNTQKFNNLQHKCSLKDKETFMHNENSNILSNNSTSFKTIKPIKTDQYSNMQQDSKFNSEMIQQQQQQSKMKDFSKYSKQKINDNESFKQQNRKKSDQLRIGNEDDERKNNILKNDKIPDTDNKEIKKRINDFSTFLESLIEQPDLTDKVLIDLLNK